MITLHGMNKKQSMLARQFHGHFKFDYHDSHEDKQTDKTVFLKLETHTLIVYFTVIRKRTTLRRNRTRESSN